MARPRWGPEIGDTTRGTGFPSAAFTTIEESGGLGKDYFFHAAPADLLRRAGRLAAAAESCRRALGLTSLEAEGKFLERRLRAMEGDG